jgi:hypothetical protein
MEILSICEVDESVVRDGMWSVYEYDSTINILMFTLL